MNQPIISIKNLSKKYNISHQKGGYIALRDVLTDIVKHPFRYLGAKAKAVAGKDSKEEFWALRDVNLEIERGEVIGVIGGNGAGKSTLLKILSQITPPTHGEAIIRGRVGSLLEVGTGFHPELSGRENITLNGAILGMTYKEIAQKFNDIVEFAGIEKFLDTPVKYYSSGMYVRLAFSVAAHMDPDILIVDEVLAVGDAEFQKKCLGKMEEVTRTAGRTVIFVSHNMGAIQKLCKKTVFMKNGKVEMFGPTDEVIHHYLEKNSSDAVVTFNPKKNVDAYVSRVSVLDGTIPTLNIPIHKKFSIEMEYEVINPVKKATLSVVISSNGNILLHSYESDSTGSLTDLNPGKYKTRVTIPPFTFNIGNYEVDISIQNPGIAFIDKIQNINFNIIDGDNPKTAIMKDNTLGNMGAILDYTTSTTK